jgi:excisionase family DNA binding protein
MTSNPITHPSVGFDLSPDQLLFTTDEAAHVLSVGRTTIYMLMRAGELMPVHIGRSCRISRGELERYVARIDAAAEREPIAFGRPPDRAVGDPPLGAA